jgi:peptide/nickel transport system substrate-binding protein
MNRWGVQVARSSRRQRNGVRIGALAACGALAVGGLAACAPSGDADDGESSITIAVSAIPGSFNPYEGISLFSYPLQAVYEPLLRDEGGFSAGLAESWEVAPEGGSIELHLRENVEYVDGTHMNADTVIEYLDDIFADPKFAFACCVAGDRPVSVEKTGEYSLKLTSTGDYRDFRDGTIPWSWWGFPIISPAAVEDRSLLDDGPQGTGPYLVDDWQPDVSISFVRNPNYWNPDAYPFDKVTYVQYTDDVAILNALKTGQVDSGVLGVDKIQEAEASGLNVTTGIGPTTYLKVTDLDGSVLKPLGDVRVRQAMAMAFDRKAIGESINLGYGYATSQLFTSDSIEYVEGGDDRYPYDVERAKELLAEAGYPDGFDLPITVAATWGAQYYPVIQQSLADIGINVIYTTVPDADLGSLLTDVWPKGTVGISTLNIAVGDAEFFIEHHGADADVQTIYKHAQNAPEPERKADLDELGKIFLDQAWYIPVGIVPSFYVSRPGYDVELINPFARYVYLDGYLKVDE